MKNNLVNNPGSASLQAVLQALMAEEQKGITFIEGGDDELFVSYAQLYREALFALYNLQQKGIQANHELIIQVDNNRQFLVIFWACLLGKIIPVPLSVSIQKEQQHKLISIWKNLLNPKLVCTENQQQRLEQFLDGLEERALAVAIVNNTFPVSQLLDRIEKGTVEVAQATDIAFIQYSSGSTGEPKGVVLSHSNLLYNTKDIQQRSSITDADKLLSWMPLTHDMGMICFHLTAVVSGAHQYLLPTQLFIRRPLLWLQKTAEHRASVLYSPNFGYQYFLNAFKKQDNYSWKLDCVRLIYNGAEPISFTLCEQFTQTLAPYGLHNQVIFPGYGLAEASVAVALPLPGDPVVSYTVRRTVLNVGDRIEQLADKDPAGVCFVETGFAIQHCEVRICDSNDQVTGEGVIGHIQIRGGNVTTQYYNNPVATRQLFTADNWLRTGDLGFLLNGRLTITGRSKNIIIINGQNYYPQDIEIAAQSVPGLMPGMVAACGYRLPEELQEEVWVFVLNKNAAEQPRLSEQIKEHISRIIGLVVDKVIFVKQIPKTTSGKVQYFKLIERYLEGQYRVQEGLVPEIAIPDIPAFSNRLLAIFKATFGYYIASADDFFAAGINSMQLSRLAMMIQQDFGWTISMQDIFEHSSLEKLARFLYDHPKKEKINIERSDKQQYPLSAGQFRFWILDQVIRQRSVLNIGVAYSINGSLNVEALQKAFHKIIQRHDSLRSNVVNHGGNAVFEVHKSNRKSNLIDHVNIAAEKNSRQKAKILAAEFVNHPFDLAADSLIRLRLINVDHNRHVLVLVIHHIIADGWSVESLLNELCILYRQYRHSPIGKLPPLPLQYPDYAAWFQQQLSAGRFSDQQRWWHDELKGELAFTSLPGLKARPAMQTFNGENLRFSLPAAVSEAITGYCKQYSTSLFSCLVAFINLLIHKYTGQQEIVLGTTTHGRTVKGQEDQIGYFLQTLIIRNVLTASSFMELVKQLQAKIARAVENQFYPFEKLVDELKLNKDTSRSPGFDVLLLLQQFQASEKLPGLGSGMQTELFPVDVAGSLLDLQLEFIEKDKGRLELSIRYNTDLFALWQIEQLVRHFESLTMEVMADPQLGLNRYSLLSDKELHQLTHQFNNTQKTYSNRSVIDLFEEQVMLHPGKEALVFGSRIMPYDRLNVLSNKLAHYLRTNVGLQPGDIVGLLMERSEHSVISMLAVLKCGAAYLPIDPDYPAARIRFMTTDSRIKALYTDHVSWQRNQWENAPFSVIFKEDFEAVCQKLANDKPVISLMPDALAYIMYTSGSTGRPKGVMISHAALVDYVNTFIHYFSVSPQDVVLQQSSFSFDTSVEEIYPALCAGAQLIMLKHEGKDIESMIMAVQQHRVTIISTTPLVVNELNMRSEDISGLRCLISGGDTLKSHYIDKLIRKMPVYNTYGPTEATVCATFHKLATATDVNTIGIPIANHQVYILDDQLNVLPAGIPGEITIGGTGLANGYIHDAALTARKFIEHPSLHKRLYRTGDLGCWQPDGTLVFIGRKDEQLKVQGYRIEPGEIAAQLTTHPQVTDALVVNGNVATGGYQLLAYYTGEDILEEYALREFLAVRLPVYMVPNRFMHVLAFPRTASGKVDRSLLPSPEPLTGTLITHPRNKTETVLLTIWEEILDKTGFGIQENFFELGGQSIKAMQVINRITALLAVKVSIRTLFSEPTIERLANFLQSQQPVPEQHILPLSQQEWYELSSAQQRIWLLHQVEEQRAAYQLALSIELTGTLNRQAFNAAFIQVIEKHESLRTVFENRRGVPVQKIQSFDGELFSIPAIDIRHVPDVEHELDILLEQEAATPFDLENGPLFRITLIQTEEHKHVVSFVIHHIIADARSLELMAAEISTGYNNLLTGSTSTFTALPIQYKDYAAWHNSVVQQPEIASQGLYWKEQFKGVLPVLELPADYQRPAIQSYEGRVETITIDAALKTALEKMGLQYGASLFMVLLSAFKTLLYRYTGQQDIIVGVPVSGRDHSLLDDQIGFYINTLAIRTKLEGEYSFQQLLEALKEQLLAAYENRYYPFDQLVDGLQLSRDLSRSPVFDVMAGFRENTGTNEALLMLDGSQAKKRKANTVASQFDLSVDFIVTGNRLDMQMEYNTGLFTQQWITRFGGHFRQLLAAIVQEPLSTLDQLEYITPEERDLLRSFNPAPQLAITTPVQVLFEAAVRKNPAAIALADTEQTLTYDMLNRQANRLAHYLRHHFPVTANSVTGILMGRSANMMVAVLAVLKAGGAYMPIDENYPAERINYIIENSGVQVLLTDSTATEKVSNSKVALVVMDAADHVEDLYADVNPGCINTANDLAYVIYTSGSTGLPKGVMVEHASLANMAAGWKEAYRLDTFPIRLLQVASFSFDVFTGDWCRALLHGGKLVICSEEARVEPALFYQLLVKHQVTIFESTPALILPLMKYIREHALDISFLKVLIIGSDTLSLTDYEKLADDFGNGLRIINSYGITEATIDSSFFEGRIEEIHRKGGITPIGKPLRNTSFYILDKQYNEVPVGIAGELFIGGSGVARGYMAQPALTAQRFVKVPLETGGLCFRTGDRASWLPDGNMLFHGRGDEQVKVRGYRIEPDEIQNALLKVPGIEQATVMVAKDPEGDDHLVAYICGRQLPDHAMIRNKLSDWLPTQMIPAYFLEVESLPLTPNGKINRKGLPQPDWAGYRKKYEAPDTANNTEMILQHIWSTLLERENISVLDDFFYLGGHSLKAIRLIYRIQEALQVKLDLRTLFMHSTIRSLAQKIATLKPVEAPGSIEQVPAADHYEISNRQRALWILEQSYPQQTSYNMPGVYRFNGILDTEAFLQAVNGLLERHESLRTVFVQVRGVIQQKIHVFVPISMRDIMADIPATGSSDTTITQHIDDIVATPFSLEEGPLVRFRLVKTGTAQHVFIFCVHHIIADGWSVDIMVNEMVSMYNAFRKQVPLSVLPLAVQQKDIIAWQLRQFTGERLEQSRQFWRKELEGVLSVCEIPGDHPRPAQRSFRGNRQTLLLDTVQADSLRQLAAGRDASVYMVLLTITHVLLYKYSGQTNLITGTSIAGRNHEQLSNQIGYYVNTLPFRLDIEPGKNFYHLLQVVKEKVLDYSDHQEYGLDRLMEDLALPYSTSRNPLFDILIVFQNTDVYSVKLDDLEGLAISEYQVDLSYTKFDLTFNFFDTREGIKIELEYSTDLFSAARIQNMLRHFGQLAVAIAALPQQAIDDLDYLSLDEKQILLSFNPPDTVIPEATVVAMFEQQVLKTPQHKAVSQGTNSITYEALNERANQLAHCLLTKVPLLRGAVVGIMLSPGIDLLIAIYGVLKAGAAYLPVDPAYPEERKRYLLQHSRALLVISEENNAPHDIPSIHLSDPEITAQPVYNLPLQAAPDDNIYVIYTSGTTGRPKGVLITHQAVTNLATWLIHLIYLSAGKPLNALLTASVSFDASVQQLFAPLLCGAHLALIAEEVKKDPALYIQAIQEASTDVLDITPSYLKALLALMKEKKQSLPVAYTLVGGELISPELSDMYRASFGAGSKLINVYGVTEATVNSTSTLVNREKDYRDIGKPLPNTQLYITDKGGHLAPIGIPGELCIGGQGLAKAYIHEPALTADRFVAAPFDQSIRLYKTGDIGYWTPEGTIVFLGRSDSQVKVRGYRIEPAEIRAVAVKQEALDEVVVMAWQPEGKEIELVMYYTAKSPVTPHVLKQYLAEQLPAYMIPSFFMQLDAFPKNGSGKLDTKALPAPVSIRDAGVSHDEEPVSPTQQRLGTIWQSLLKVPCVGLQDNFFDLGGHSLKATRLISEVYRALDVELSLKNIFLHPTLGKMAACIDGLKLVQRQETDNDTSEPVYYPASPAQRRFWILAQMNNAHIAYNIVSSYMLEGMLDRAAFEKSLVSLVERHEVLRTTFLMEGEEIVQKIHQPWAVTDFLFFVDHRKEAASLPVLASLTAAEAGYVFDFSRGPLLRIHFVQLNDSRFALLFNIHHIISDGWSTQVLINDLISLYNGFSTQSKPLLDPLTGQYKDFALKQLEGVNQDVFAEHRTYWLHALSNRPGVLQLDYDLPRPAIKTYNGAIHQLVLPASLRKQLQVYARQQEVTLFMVLIAAVKTLLYRYTGQEDILVGTAVAGRNHAALLNQVGCYVNTVVLPGTIQGANTFDQLLQQVKETILDVFEHQDYPFDLLVEELQLPRDVSRSPLFDVMVTLLNINPFENGWQSMQGISIQEQSIPDSYCKFDLTFNFRESDERLILDLEYNKDLFLPERIAEMAMHVHTLLASVSSNGQVPVQAIEYMTDQEKERLLVHYNDTIKLYPPHQTLQGLFEARVKNAPLLLSLQYGERQYTYEQLNEQVNRLAHYLISEAGLQPGDLAGIMIPKSDWTIIAMLAILKAGAAYVPIDPAYPETRKQFLLKDSAIGVLLTIADTALTEHVRTVVNLEEKNWVDYPSNNPAIQPTTDPLAYVMYTSGTTGQPKGVLVKQASVINLTNWLQDLIYYRFCSLRVMLTASVSFDSSVKQIYPALLSGSCLVLLPDPEKQEIHTFINRLQQDAIDIVDVTPSYLQLMLAAWKQKATAVPRYFLSGGEELGKETIHHFYQKFGESTQLINVYGVTEATVDSTYEIVSPGGRSTNSIGKPITNTMIYLLDGQLQLVPAGVRGEICIAGAGVAAGYLHRSDLTTQQFCKDPFRQQGQLYRTGDIGKWLPDGSIAFLGRKDNQVKIMGYRIEPGEVEGILQQYPGIGKVVVLAIKDTAGEYKLVAYYTHSQRISSPLLRNFLHDQLPVYMIPTDFIQVTSFPLTTHGKLDTNALLQASLSLQEKADQPWTPTDNIEKDLMTAWKKVLGDKSLGMRDNFFEAGGNSLKVIRLYNTIRELHDVNIQVHQLFSYATIEKQASLIKSLLPIESPVPAAQQEEIKEVEF